MKKKSSNFSTILLIIILLAGLSLLLYPSISNYYNSFHQTRAITDYTQTVANMKKEEYDKILSKAQSYNQSLLSRGTGFAIDESQKDEYEKLLNISGLGIMGYIEIPSINVSLPIYHGIEDSVLQIAVGHLEWSSLPVGGTSSHCVLSGHRGLPSAKLFTNLDKMNAGDIFLLRVLDEVLTYEVDQVLVVEPQEVNTLTIVPGKDYCTLVTCTPYGINSHRLLVRGHRIENPEEAAIIHVTADATQIEPLLIAPVIAIPILTLLILLVLFSKPKRKSKFDDIETE